MIPEFSLEEVDECASTNQALLEREGSVHGVALLTKRQTAGQGRRGRTWLAPEGNLSISFGLESGAADVQWLPYRFGVALHRAILPFTGERRLGLKWPNDLFLEGKKLAGILVQARQQGGSVRAVVGVGLNVFSAPEGAASLRLVNENPPVAKTIAVQLLKELAAPVVDLRIEWERRCMHLEDWVTVIDPEMPARDGWRATALGLAGDGGLRVRREDGSETVIYGEEVSVQTAEPCSTNPFARLRP